ncbi:MAG: hypothetical protein JNM17_04885 [Archangium sp.]|nr:hypothetical protein [Archangium sp.]
MQDPAARPTDDLSVLALAAGIGSIVLLLFSILPLVGMCFGPLSAISALTAIATGIASLVRIARRPELDGRYQALTGIGFALVWGVGIAVLLLVIAKKTI